MKKKQYLSAYFYVAFLCLLWGLSAEPYVSFQLDQIAFFFYFWHDVYTVTYNEKIFINVNYCFSGEFFY